MQPLYRQHSAVVGVENLRVTIYEHPQEYHKAGFTVKCEKCKATWESCGVTHLLDYNQVYHSIGTWDYLFGKAPFKMFNCTCNDKQQ